MAEIVIYHHLYNRNNFTAAQASVPESTNIEPAALDVSAGADFSPEHILMGLSKITALLGLTMAVIAYSPASLNWVQNESINLISQSIGTAAKNAQTQVSVQETFQKEDYQPPLDPSLPKTNRLIIPSIGVKTDIAEATLGNYEDALKKGVWRVSDFGDPANRNKPTIMAAHRYGYLAWTNQYRRLNSFYNLPKAKVGDTVEVDWQGRRYLYEIYALGKGEDISDYSADLILYTCESLTGTQKNFVYARLLRV